MLREHTDTPLRTSELLRLAHGARKAIRAGADPYYCLSLVVYPPPEVMDAVLRARDGLLDYREGNGR